MPDSRVYDLAVDANNNIWCATRQGLAKFDGSDWEVYKFEHLEANGYISSLAIDKDGSIWVTNAYSPYRIAKFNNGEFIPYNGENTGITSINWCQAIDFDSKGNIWFVAGYLYSDSLGGLIKYDGHDWTHYDKHNSGMTNHQLSSIAVDSNDVVWLGGYYNGLTKFDGTTWSNFIPSNSGISGEGAYQLCIDKFNNKWMVVYSELTQETVGLEVFREGGVLLPSNVEELFRGNDDEITPRLYPNPASEIITVSDIGMRPRKFTITNILGQVMLGGQFYHEINISKLPKGYYFLHFEQFHLSFFKI